MLMHFTRIGAGDLRLQLESIIWDLDGTLVDSAPDLHSALNTILDKRGFAGHSLATVRTMIGNGVPKLVERGFNAIGIRLEPAQLAVLVEMFVKEYKACATDLTRPYPGVVEALEYIHKVNIPMGVCTNKPEALSRQILEDLGLSVYFQSVIGGDSTDKRKPDPLPLLTCLSELGAEPGASLMIGDSIHDVHAAHSAGVLVGVVPWGYRSTPVEDLGADFIIHDLAGLPDLIRNVNPHLRQTDH
jgi:phosphoglycolate phosphatase